MSSLNPFRNRNGSRSRGSAIGRGIKNGGRRLLGWLNPFGGKKNPPKTKKQKQADNQPTGWTEVPLNPNHTKWKDREMGAPAPRRVPKPTAGAPRGGGLTKAAEQFAGTLAKPPTEVNTLKTFDSDLGDLAGAVEAIRGGLNQHTSVVEAGMPAETYAHEQLRQFTRQVGQIAEGLRGLQGDAKRRLALDHERVDNGRPNERGYDWQNNQQ